MTEEKDHRPDFTPSFWFGLIAERGDKARDKIFKYGFGHEYFERFEQIWNDHDANLRNICKRMGDLNRHMDNNPAPQLDTPDKTGKV